MPEEVLPEDARFGSRKIEGRKYQAIRCDCPGCIDDVDLDGLMDRARQYKNRHDWDSLAELLTNQCCSLRKKLFNVNDEKALFFDKDDGNWRYEAVWCGGGAMKKEAYQLGLIDASWYCHACLAKLAGLPDAAAWRKLWVERWKHRAVENKKWKVKYAEKKEKEAEKEAEYEEGHRGGKGKHGKGKQKGKSKADFAKKRKAEAEGLPDELTFEGDEQQRIRVLSKELKEASDMEEWETANIHLWLHGMPAESSEGQP